MMLRFTWRCGFVKYSYRIGLSIAGEIERSRHSYRLQLPTTDGIVVL
jgi:hypothetical protein